MNTERMAITPALSLRQPWAWLVVNGFKDVENRVWSTRYRGKCLIHAGKGMTWGEYNMCQEKCNAAGALLGVPFELPEADRLVRGAIIGEVEIVDCVAEHSSFWFTGPYAFVLRNAKGLPTQRCRGALAFFDPATGRRIA